ncbi:DUF4932 domain-containing protein [Mucilaginibacter robiniae]|uniref:DUF4932 domain-containing protein n=1 Tax=Mucilaginibacter robiniae TaxID=2728022 RepID=A0A7L5E5Q8_9SPHI|nr:DUF4932 domain-containing protein [Mucilaginibacter robiniae]QJD97958.1 DUF4932 domain-containing protein [Mucilaginibacter robiniae]
MNIIFKSAIISVMLLCFAAITLNGCKSTDIASRYTSKYINSNTNKVIAQVPEAYELGYIILALTDYSQRDTNLIDTHSQYYHDVIRYFNNYKNHRAVVLLNQEISRNFKYFHSFRDGLYAFQLSHNRLSLKSDYRIDLNKFNFKRFAPLMRDFASKSNFVKFYNDHQSFYTQLTNYQQQQLTIEAAQKMVEKDYTMSFNSYKIVLSPLMNGYPGTLAINSRRFTECLIFTQTINK